MGPLYSQTRTREYFVEGPVFTKVHDDVGNAVDVAGLGEREGLRNGADDGVDVPQLALETHHGDVAIASFFVSFGDHGRSHDLDGLEGAHRAISCLVHGAETAVSDFFDDLVAVLEHGAGGEVEFVFAGHWGPP